MCEHGSQGTYTKDSTVHREYTKWNCEILFVCDKYITGKYFAKKIVFLLMFFAQMLVKYKHNKRVNDWIKYLHKAWGQLNILKQIILCKDS